MKMVKCERNGEYEAKRKETKVLKSLTFLNEYVRNDVDY